LPQERDIQEEQRFLDSAYEGLEAMRRDATGMLESVLDLGRGGTFQSRTERDIVVRTSMARLAQLDIGDQALTFGRIDRVPDAEHPAGESFHIGRLAVWGADHDPLIVDWRAPVAEPFYRATGLDPQGLSRRRHLAVSGRTVTGVEDEYFSAAGDGRPDLAGCGGRAVRDAGRLGEPGDGHADGLATEGIQLGGPGALLAALGRARTGQMSDIVATIQREQDEIIRAAMGGVLIVQGGPGTGKTAVALHRAAYLLYTHRFPLERQGVLVVGPNPLFLRYIERVLPSLGETGVVLSTVAGLVPEIKVRAEDTPRVARLKGDARMAVVLERAVSSRERPLRRGLEAAFGATTLRLSPEDSESIVASARRRSGTHNARRRVVERHVLERLARQYDRARRRAAGGANGGGGAADSDLTDADLGADGRFDGGAEAELAGLGRQIRRLPAVAEALDRMWPRLSPHEFVHDLLGALPLLRAAARGLLSQEEIRSLYRPRSATLDGVPWTAADAALVDEARSLLGPRRPRPRQRSDSRGSEQLHDEAAFWPGGLGAGPVPTLNGQHAVGEDEVRSFGHIVVDEAQDLSAMQLRMLGRRSISGSMTVVGDVAQATGPSAPASWDEIGRHLSATRAPRMAELTVAYRTPAEVMEVAAGVLAAAAPGLRPPRPVRRSGVAPVVHATTPTELAARTAEVAAEEVGSTGEGRTAVLAPAAMTERLTSALAAGGLDPVDPRDPSGPGLAAPLVVLPAVDSHGLEFDSVVVVEPAAIAAGEEWTDGQAAAATRPGLRALYVALTRPTRRLTVVRALPLPEGLVFSQHAR
jgi:DNA helicase IV